MKKFNLIAILAVTFTLVLSGCNSSADFNPDDQDKKLAEFANPQKYISVNELNANLEQEKDFVVFGVIDPKNVTAKEIDGAFLVWRDDYSGSSKDLVSEELGGGRFDQKAMESILSKAGVEKDTTVVVYAANDHHDAARFAWQIESLGHENVRILDGGINAWTGAKMATGKATRIADVKENASEYKAEKYDKDLGFADAEMVVEALQNPDEWVVIDTRSEAESTGADTKDGAFGKGGLEGAVWIEWTQATDEETLLKSKAELEKIYGDLEGKKVITFCQSGVRSAFTYEVLVNALGFEEVYNYDGSWIEWSYLASSKSEGKADEQLRKDVLGLTSNWTELEK